MRTLHNRIKGRLARSQWFIAYRMATEGEAGPDDFTGFVPLASPPDRYWADPFPVQWNGGYALFFEEFLYSTGRGRIAVREWRDGHWSEPRVVLERPYHLSYPFVFSWQNKWYMVPESLGSRAIELWCCDEFPHRWRFERNLMEGIQAADSTIFERDGRWWMFSCIATEGAAACDELFLFHAPTPLGPWCPHRRNPVVSDARRARPAGRPFLHGGKWLRPSQDCTGEYGRRIVMHEIERLAPDEYQERVAWTIEPTWSRGLIGTHTWNSAGDLTVIDGRRWRWLGRAAV